MGECMNGRLCHIGRFAFCTLGFLAVAMYTGIEYYRYSIYNVANAPIWVLIDHYRIPEVGCLYDEKGPCYFGEYVQCDSKGFCCQPITALVYQTNNQTTLDELRKDYPLGTSGQVWVQPDGYCYLNGFMYDTSPYLGIMIWMIVSFIICGIYTEFLIIMYIHRPVT